MNVLYEAMNGIPPPSIHVSVPTAENVPVSSDNAIVIPIEVLPTSVSNVRT